MKKILIVLMLIINLGIFADEYIVIWSQNEYMTAEMLQKYNKSLLKYGEVKYSELEEYQKIKWEEGEKEQITTIDIDNDGNLEKIIKTDKYLNGYITEVIDIYKENGKVGNVGEFEKNKYELKNMPKEGEYYNYMAGRFEINPFIYKDRTYISIESKYGNHEFMLIVEYNKEKKIKEMGYYIKVIDSEHPIDIWAKYQEAMKEYRKSKKISKVLEILEEEGQIKKILRNKGEITDKRYISLLNDYAFFLSETENKYGEAIPILRDVIYLDPKRAVTYINLGDVYGKIGDKAKELRDYSYFKYSSLLKEGAKIPSRVKSALTNYEEKKIELINISKPDFKDKYILVMSENDDVSQHMLGVVNNELNNYGKLEYRTAEFNQYKWEDKIITTKTVAGELRKRESKRSYIDINNDGEIEIVEKKRPFIGDFYFDELKFFKNSELDEKLLNDRTETRLKFKGAIYANMSFLSAKYLPLETIKSKYWFNGIDRINVFLFKDINYVLLEEKFLPMRLVLIKKHDGYKRYDKGEFYPHIEHVAYYIRKIIKSKKRR